MDREIRVGDVVRHFKNQYVEDKKLYKYVVIGLAENIEIGEQMVIYQALYGEFKVYTMLYEMFVSEVDKGKYPDSVQLYRFEVIDHIYIK